MAINLNCNLNGGDTVTPNNELFYRIYGDADGYSVPIHTTGTAISDGDVTVTGDVVDISNVDGTTNSSFKIAAVDGEGNEGVLSNAASSGPSLFAVNTNASLTEESLGEWVTDANSWAGYAVSQTPLTGDFEFECLYENRTEAIDSMMGLSEDGVLDIHNGTDRWLIRLYPIISTDTLQQSEMPETSLSPTDNTTPLPFNAGDKLKLARTGTTVYAYFNDTLYHTFTGSYPNPLYMHFSPKDAGQYMSQPKRI